MVLQVKVLEVVTTFEVMGQTNTQHRCNMRLDQYISRFTKEVPMFVEIGQSKILDLVVEDDHLSIKFESDTFPKLSRECQELLAHYGRQGEFLHKLEIWLMAELFGNGPKIFRPTTYQLCMLEQMTLNIDVNDFHMPFPLMVIEFPEEYSKARALPDMYPNLSILCKKDEMLIHSVASAEYAHKSWWRGVGNVENWFDPPDYITNTSNEEVELEALVKRAVLNYCLLLDETGVKDLGRATPNQYTQLVKYAAKNNKHTALNRKQLAAQGTVYGPKSVVELVRTVASVSDLGEGGSKVGPHGRRGHYRMQPYGPKGTLRKRIRIPFTLVNAHLLNGPVTQIYRS